MRTGLMTPPTESATAAPPAGPPPQQPIPPEAAPPEAPAGEGGYPDPMDDPLSPESYLDGGKASIEEQTQYEEVTGLAMHVLHGKQLREKFLSQIEKANGAKVPKVLGQIAFIAFTKAEAKYRADGKDMFDSVKMEVAEDLLAELVTMAMTMGKVGDTENDAGIAFTGALDIFAAAYGNQTRERGNYSIEKGQKSLAELLQVADRRFPLKKTAASVKAAMDAEAARAQELAQQRTQAPAPAPEGGPPGLMTPAGGMQ